VGTTIDTHRGSYINSMALNNETQRLYVVTSCKKILVFDTETGEKLFQFENGHTKNIYGVVITPESSGTSCLTCSSDNTFKTWKFDEESK